MFNTYLSSVLGELNSVASSSLLYDNRLWLRLGVICLIGVIIYLMNKNRVKLPEDITEQTKNLQNKIKEEMGETTAIAQEKINTILDEYKRLLPYGRIRANCRRV